MHGLIVEEGSFGANPGTKDIARHLYTRMYYGKVVIVTNKPVSVISPLRKQWLRLTRKVQRERSSTLNGVKISELSSIIGCMQNLKFTTHYPPDEHEGDVYLAAIEQILRWPPVCRTMYIACDIEKVDSHLITAWMPPGSLVVICKLA
jgi:hypothetical protein